RPEAQRDAPPMIRTAAKISCAPPLELLTFGDGVRLAFDVPPPDAPVILTVVLGFRRRTSARRRVSRREHRRIMRAVPFRAGLEQHDSRSSLCQDISGHSSARSRANDTYVIRPIALCHTHILRTLILR